jgi:hypothetical protein
VKVKSLGKKEQEISWIKFCLEGVMTLHWKEYKVLSWIDDNKVYSIWMNVED